jgi:hypothetical protein
MSSQFCVAGLYAEPVPQDPTLMEPSLRHMMKRKQLPGYGWREWSPNGKTLFAGHLKPERNPQINEECKLFSLYSPTTAIMMWSRPVKCVSCMEKQTHTIFVVEEIWE